MAKPTPKELCDATGISPSYASMILSDDPDKARTPPRSLAIFIYRKTGWAHECIAALTEEEMTVFERHEPWEPPQKKAPSATNGRSEPSTPLKSPPTPTTEKREAA